MSELQYNIRVTSGKRELVAIDDFRLTASAITILFGESGIGKSLSALAIAGLIDPDQLDARVNGMPYDEYLRGRDVAAIRNNGFFVFQEPSSHLNPMLTLRTQIDEGSLAGASADREILRRLWQGSTEADVEKILDVYPKPYRPSGGEKQRMLAAMAFKKMSTLTPSVPGALYIFDEPTGNLDNKLRDEFLDLLVENVRARNITVLLITHDYSMVSRFTNVYAGLAKRIFYKELLVDRGRLKVRDFKPEEYLSWLDVRRRRSSNETKQGAILKLEPHLSVFGRTLTISRDREGRNPTPLFIRKGAMSYLKAPSGTGKTTIVKLMMGLLQPQGMTMQLGSVVFTERTPRALWAKHVWGRQMTLVFQHADEALNQNARVEEVFGGLPLTGTMNNARILETLSQLFDEKPDREFLRKPVKYLSGGQKQRLNLLRSMVLDTDILILDEPLNGLDFASSVKVIDNLEDKLSSGRSVMVISHNEEIFDALTSPENTYYLQAVDTA
ncbi:MAG TPA: ATP-binding cassette domain-containing protein [Bacteroidota bacterium]